MMKKTNFCASIKMRIVIVVLSAFSFYSSGRDIISISTRPHVPAPSEMDVSVETSGRTSILKSVDIAEITSSDVPDTFADTLIHNTPGFKWYVSRHFAIKTNLDKTDAAESLALLETAWPQYAAIFGRTPPGMAYRRLAIVLATDRNSLERAMIDDDMHVLNLGGITQEGFACAYLYAGISYQTRYILLHESTHLFQYCISGNTRSSYGFFVEGIADFFSSHVFDKATRTLTVNVLDRAPIHNHLATGIEEWQRLGRPSFSDLYENHRGSRGLDVILTAFLQSTPDFERNWLAYCAGISENADTAKAKLVSDTLIYSLYGDKSFIDKAFSEWMEQLTPSFLTGIREFDQDGDSFISVYAPSESLPATLTLTNPSLSVSDFVLDWPHSAQIQQSVATPPQASASSMYNDSASGVGFADTRHLSNLFFSVNIALPAAEERPVTAGLRFYSREMRLINEVAITNSASKQISRCLSFTEAELTDPPAPAKSCIAEMFASAPGVVFTPVSFSSKVFMGKAQKTAAGCRFLSTASLPRLISAAKILGQKVPQQLQIAIEALKAPTDKTLVIPEDTETREFWYSIAEEILKANTTLEIKMKALCELSGLKLSVSKIPGDRVLIELQNTFPIPEKADAVLITHEGRFSQPERNGVSSFTFIDPHSMTKASVSVMWLGHRLEFETEYDGGREITDWHVLGPFRMTAGKTETFPPDTYPLDMDKVFTADDGSRVFWKKTKASGGNQNTPPLLHFAKEFGRQANNSVAYAYTEIECDKKGTFDLVLGVSDGISVWNNSTLIFSDLKNREWSDGNIRIPVSLKKGTNQLLFKLFHTTGVWFLSARLCPRSKK